MLAPPALFVACAHQWTRKSPSPVVDGENTKLGAGEASYFEWAEVHACFARKPTRAEQEQIKARVPPPLKDSIEFHGHHLMAASGQFAHAAMAEAYPGEGDPNDESQWDNGRWFFASVDQVDAFNEDTESWLRETHGLCPIVAAYRSEDCESGGTHFSSWHQRSLDHFEDVISKMSEILKQAGERTQEPLDHMLRGIIEMGREARKKVPDFLLEIAMPGTLEVKAAKRGDLDGLRARLSSGKIRKAVLETLGDELDHGKTKDRAALLAIADLILEQEEIPEELAEQLAMAAALAGETAVLRGLERCVKADEGLGNRLAYAAYTCIAKKKRFREAIELFDLVLCNSSLEESAYCNATYAVMEDNSGIPHNKERTERFIARSHPKVGVNPRIYLNLVCLYFELGDNDSALKVIRQALDSGDRGPKEFENEALITPLRATKGYKDLIAQQ